MDALAGSDTVATLLPAADFCTRNPYPDARRLLDAGVTVALGADCNPGTAYTTSLAFCLALAVRDLRMSPDEALWAATAGGARALRRADVGVLTPLAPAPTWRSWTPRAACTWPTGPGCPWCARSSRTASRPAPAATRRRGRPAHKAAPSRRATSRSSVA